MSTPIYGKIIVAGADVNLVSEKKVSSKTHHTQGPRKHTLDYAMYEGFIIADGISVECGNSVQYDSVLTGPGSVCLVLSCMGLSFMHQFQYLQLLQEHSATSAADPILDVHIKFY